MNKSQATWLAVIACVLVVAAGCSMPAEPQSGTDTRTKQGRDRTDNPSDGMKRVGGGGGMK
jgi:hypothetical protein